MSHWLGSAPHSTPSAAASLALAAELRLEASRFAVIADFLARAYRAIPDAVDCEGWMGRARSSFDERVLTLAQATLAGSHHAETAARECSTLANEAEERAAMAVAVSGAP